MTTKQDEENLVVIGVLKKVLRENRVFLSRMATQRTLQPSSTSYAEGIEMLKHQWPIIQRESWNEGIGTKRKMMAECLVPVQVKPDLLCSLHVVNAAARYQVMRIVGQRQICVILERHMFFKFDINDA